MSTWLRKSVHCKHGMPRKMDCGRLPEIGKMKFREPTYIASWLNEPERSSLDGWA